MKLAIDIDGILTQETEGHDYGNRTPNYENINKVNFLFDKGYTIILFSSRYWRDYFVTRRWLKKYNIKYHKIRLKKLQYNYIIDDRAYSSMKEFMIKIC